MLITSICIHRFINEIVLKIIEHKIVLLRRQGYLEQEHRANEKAYSHFLDFVILKIRTLLHNKAVNAIAGRGNVIK